MKSSKLVLPCFILNGSNAFARQDIEKRILQHSRPGIGAKDGVPKNIIDKIFQPFFTAKPMRQEASFGLSLSYEIVKVHGGEIKVKTGESEACSPARSDHSRPAFIIQIPFNQVL